MPPIRLHLLGPASTGDRNPSIGLFSSNCPWSWFGLLCVMTIFQIDMNCIKLFPIIMMFPSISSHGRNFFLTHLSIASYQEEENSHWTRTGMGQSSFASRFSPGILLNHQLSLGHLKKRFNQSSTITLHPYCNYLLGPVFCFFNFVMLLKWWLSILYLAKFGNIQIMEVKNLKHPFIL